MVLKNLIFLVLIVLQIQPSVQASGKVLGIGYGVFVVIFLFFISILIMVLSKGTYNVITISVISLILPSLGFLFFYLMPKDIDYVNRANNQ